MHRIVSRAALRVYVRRERRDCENGSAMRTAAIACEPWVTAAVLVQLLESAALPPEAAQSIRRAMADEGVTLAHLIRDALPVPLRWLAPPGSGLTAERAACIGYAAGREVRPTTFPPLSLSLISASTVAEVVRLLDYLPVVTNALHAEVTHLEPTVDIRFSPRARDPVLDAFVAFYFAAAFPRLLSLLAVRPLTLNVALAAPRPRGLPDDPCNPMPRFDAARHRLWLPASELTIECRFADHSTHRAQLAALAATRMPTDPLIEQLRELLYQRPQRVSVEAAAAALGMSVATLKRRLRAGGTAFRTLREAVSRERAIRLLGDPTVSIETVADALGYSEPANFAHAFKRWTGLAPGVFRRRLVGRAAVARAVRDAVP